MACQIRCNFNLRKQKCMLISTLSFNSMLVFFSRQTNTTLNTTAGEDQLSAVCSHLFFQLSSLTIGLFRGTPPPACGFWIVSKISKALPGGSVGKEFACNAGTAGNLSSVRSLGWEDPLEKGMTTRFSVFAWRTPRTEESGGLQSMGSMLDTTEHASMLCCECSALPLGV